MFTQILFALFACGPEVAPEPGEAGSGGRADLPAALVEKGSLAGHTQQAYLGAYGSWDVAEVTGDGAADLVAYVANDQTGGPWTPALWVLPGPLLGDFGRADVHVIFAPYAEEIDGFGAGDIDGDGVSEVWTGAWLLSGPLVADVDLATEPEALVGEGCWLGSGHLGDLDGDGAVELLLSCADVRHVVYGAAPDEPLVDHARTSTALSPLGLGDLDGDGLDDLAWQRDDDFSVAMGPIGPVLDDADADAHLAGVQSLASAGDADGDGAIDLMASVYDRTDREYRCHVLEGPVAGEIVLTDAIATIDSSDDVWAMDGRGLGDLDGDGFVDAGGGDRDWPHPHGDEGPDEVEQGQLWLVAGPLEGGLEPSPWVHGSGLYTYLRDVRAVGDLDGDGLPEIGYADPDWDDPYYAAGVVRWFGMD